MTSVNFWTRCIATIVLYSTFTLNYVTADNEETHQKIASRISRNFSSVKSDLSHGSKTLRNSVKNYTEIYKRLLPCIMNSRFAHKKIPSNWSYPFDAEEHYSNLLFETRMYRNFTIHEGPAGFMGPWMENYYIEHFIGRDLSYFNGFIPLFIQWTDLHVADIDRNEPKYNNSIVPIHKEMLQRIASLLRPDVMYLAVSQDDQGIFTQLVFLRPNILSLSAGGFGHIPIPLIKGELNYTEAPKNFELDVGFFGSLRPRLSRFTILSEIQHALEREHMKFKINPSNEWEHDISRSKFNLAPRGFGRTSYRLAEIIQIGRIPVYLYDDISWLPYEETDLALSNYGFVGKMGSLNQMVKDLKNVSEKKIQGMLEKVKIIREHYTYKGVLKQIEKFLYDPLGPEGGQLKCAKVPDKDHRMIFR